MDKKYWIILNPIAGKGKALAIAPKIDRFLSKKGLNYEIIKTNGPGDAITIVKNLALAENDAVIAAGGDGTCNEVVNGLLLRSPAPSIAPIFGVLPIGRGNDFSFTPGIPTDIEKALEILVQFNLKTLDAGIVKGGFFPDGRYFINGVGIGFDTKVGFEAAKMKIKSGIAYLFGAIINIVRYDPSPVIQMRYDENEMTHPAALVSVVNGKRMGGTFYMGPNALLDDGLLDICCVRRPPTRRKLIKAVYHYTKGTQATCEGVYMGRGVNFKLTALEGGMAAHCDGETICYEGKELVITCIPGALRFIGV